MKRSDKFIIAAVALLASNLAVATAIAGGRTTGGFELGRSTVSGSGGQSSGGNFTTQTTTSQPDAGKAVGGEFDVTGSVAAGDPSLCSALAVASGLLTLQGFCPGVRLSWLDNSSHETGYRILRDSTQIAVTGPDATMYDDSTAVPGVAYSYAVVTRDDCSDASPSNIAAGHRPANPIAPDGVHIAGIQILPDSIVVNLNWHDNSPDEVAQIIYQVGASTTTVKTVSPNVQATSFVIHPVGATAFCFAVAAANCGLEARSDTTCMSLVDVPEQPAAIALPTTFALAAITPNPFSARAAIAFDVPREARLAIRIFDVGGRVIRTLKAGSVSPGRYAVQWDGRDEFQARASSGIYFVEMRAPGYRRMMRLTLLK